MKKKRGNNESKAIRNSEHNKITGNYNKPGVNENEHTAQTAEKIINKNEFAEKKPGIYKDRKSKMIDDIKQRIDHFISSGEYSYLNFSFYLSKELGYNYTYLTNVFSGESGITIKKYLILKKIEFAKNAILKDYHSLKEIASMLNYKSASHFSNQFKKISGISPIAFRKKQTK